MPAPINHLKAALARDEVQRGLWMTLGSEAVTEIAGQSGFDWCLIDGEHAPYDPGLIQRQLMALAGTPAQAVVRVPVNEDWVIKQVLDQGAQTILVPMVHSAADAERAVRACRYPPEGIRGMGGTTMRASGYGAIPDYPATANEQICVMVQAESCAAFADLEAIAATEGVDCVFIGPADLAADMGLRDDMGAPELWAEIRRGIDVIRAAGKAPGIIVSGLDREIEMIEAGVSFLGVGSDANALSGALRGLAEGRE